MNNEHFFLRASDTANGPMTSAGTAREFSFLGASAVLELDAACKAVAYKLNADGKPGKTVLAEGSLVTNRFAKPNNPSQPHYILTLTPPNGEEQHFWVWDNGVYFKLMPTSKQLPAGSVFRPAA